MIPAPAETEPLSGTLLGFDFGEKRLGVAVGESETRLAHPVAVIAEEATGPRFAAIERLVAEWRPAGFVAIMIEGLMATERATDQADSTEV